MAAYKFCSTDHFMPHLSSWYHQATKAAFLQSLQVFLCLPMAPGPIMGVGVDGSE